MQRKWSIHQLIRIQTVEKQLKDCDYSIKTESPRNQLRRLPNLNTNFTKLHNRVDCSLKYGLP